MLRRGAAFLVFLVLGLAILVELPEAEAIPYYARKYRTECSTCHVTPPKLNETGEEFLAAGYRFPDEDRRDTRRTVPLSVWSSWRGQWDDVRGRGRGLPNRVEIISAGPIARTRAFYFVEWLPVSQEVGGNNQRVQRHGRFEDLFVSIPAGPLRVSVGQYRQLTQVDVSRRLSLSEPLAFSAGLTGRAARSSRLTGLRSFSLSGRSPAVRVSHHWQRGAAGSDGWYNNVTVPFAGEFVIPLNSTVHRTRGFEFEARPKGVLYESYYRRGLASVGGHVFAGDSRQQYGLVAAANRGPFFTMLATGWGRERSGERDFRISWENEFIPVEWVTLGLRLDDRTGPNRPAALHPYVNIAFPLTWYTVRMTLERRQQRGNHAWLLELGTVF